MAPGAPIRGRGSSKVGNSTEGPLATSAHGLSRDLCGERRFVQKFAQKTVCYTPQVTQNEVVMSVAVAFVSECSVVEAAVGLSDRDLARCVADCAARERQSLAGLLGFLAEFDARDLHEPAGFDALYKYLMHHFGWSVSSTFKRIQAARACRRFPELLPPIAAGDLNLSAVCALAPVLTADNLSRVLFEAARLPREELKVYIEDLRAEQTPEPAPARPVTPFQLTLGAAIASGSLTSSERTPVDPRWTPPPSPLVRRAAELTSLNVKVDASFHALFARVKALCAHGPTGRDPARVLRRGLEMLLEAEEKRRFGAPSSLSLGRRPSGARKCCRSRRKPRLRCQSRRSSRCRPR